jgi:tetratricopeptide (TPR) repeat protein
MVTINLLRYILTFIVNQSKEDKPISDLKYTPKITYYDYSLLLVGDHFRQTTELKNAVKIFKVILDEYPDFLQLLLVSGNIHAQLYQFEMSVDNFQKAIELKPFTAGAWNNLGISLFSLGRYREAIFAFILSLTMEQNSVVWYNLGNLQFKLGKFIEAIESFNESIKVRPIFNALLNASGLLIQNNQFDIALKYLNMLNQISPNDARIYINNGLLMERLGNTEGALDFFEKSLGLDIRNFLGWYNRGNILCDKRNYKEALDSFKIALQIYPEDSHAINNKGYVQFLLGEYHDALSSFEMAMKFEKNNIIAANNYNKTHNYLMLLAGKSPPLQFGYVKRNRKNILPLDRNISSFSYIEQALEIPIVN